MVLQNSTNNLTGAFSRSPSKLLLKRDNNDNQGLFPPFGRKRFPLSRDKPPADYQVLKSTPSAASTETSGKTGQTRANDDKENCNPILSRTETQTPELRPPSGRNYSLDNSQNYSPDNSQPKIEEMQDTSAPANDSSSPSSPSNTDSSSSPSLFNFSSVQDAVAAAGGHVRKRHYAKALKIFQQIIAWNKSGQNDMGVRYTDPTLQATTWHNIGLVHVRCGNDEQALDAFKRSITIGRQETLILENKGQLGDSVHQPSVATSLIQIGLLFLKRKQFSDAILAFSEALEIRLKLYGLYHPLVAKVHTQIAIANLHMGNRICAKKEFENVLTIQRTIVGKFGGLAGVVNTIEHDELHAALGVNENMAQLDVASTLCNMGLLLLEPLTSDYKILLSQASEAAKHLREAYSIQSLILDPSSPTLQKTVANLKKAMDQVAQLDVHQLMSSPSCASIEPFDAAFDSSSALEVQTSPEISSSKQFPGPQIVVESSEMPRGVTSKSTPTTSKEESVDNQTNPKCAEEKKPYQRRYFGMIDKQEISQGISSHSASPINSPDVSLNMPIQEITEQDPTPADELGSRRSGLTKTEFSTRSLNASCDVNVVSPKESTCAVCQSKSAGASPLITPLDEAKELDAVHDSDDAHITRTSLISPIIYKDQSSSVITRDMLSNPKSHLRQIHQAAIVYIQQEKYDHALHFFKALLDFYRTSDPSNIVVGATYHNMGVIYHAANYLNDSYDSFNKAIRHRKRYLGAMHEDVSYSLVKAAIVKMAIKKGGLDHSHGASEEALALLQEALAIRRKHFGNIHLLVAKVLNNIGCAYMDSNKPQQAMGSFESAIDVQRALSADSGGKDNYDANTIMNGIAVTLCNLALVYSQLSKHEKCSICYMEALTIQEHVLQMPGFPVLSATLYGLAESEARRHEDHSALRQYARILQFLPDDDTDEVDEHNAFIFTRTGKLHARQRDYDSSLNNLLMALSSRTKRVRRMKKTLEVADRDPSKDKFQSLYISLRQEQELCNQLKRQIDRLEKLLEEEKDTKTFTQKRFIELTSTQCLI